MFFPMGGEPPPEVREQLERQHLEEVALQQEVRRFLKELPPHQLYLVHTILYNIAVGNSELLAQYYFGLVSGHMEHAGVCLGCGKDHLDEDLKGLTGEQVQPGPEAEDPLMKEYNVRPIEGEVSAVVCANPKCTRRWNTMEDRVAEGKNCEGCAHIARWG